MADYESVLCVKNEVFVYRIPARTSNRGYRAAEWKLDEPDWTGRLKVVAKGQALTVRLEDKNSGELFAQCPVDCYPSAAVEQVLDSSRYFVLRIQDGSGRAAFIGLGFADRGDSFDLVVAIQDHFKQLKREEAAKSDEVAGISQLNLGPKLDLSFKEGQTITINIATKKSGESSTQSSSAAGAAKPRARAAPGTGVSPLLPPPPGSGTRVAALPKQPAAAAVSFQEQPVRPPPISNSGVIGGGFMQPTAAKPSASYNSPDSLFDFGSSPPKPAAAVVGANSGVTGSADLLGGDWDDFSRTSSSQLPAKVHATTHQPLSDHNWVNFD